MNRLIDSPIEYHLCTTEKRFRKCLKRAGIDCSLWPQYINDGADATTHHFENSDGRKMSVVCFRRRDGIEGLQESALLVHEAVHVWQEIRESIGERHPSSEFEAYSIQSITQNLLYELQRQTKKDQK